MPKQWFEIKAKGKTLDVSVHDEIGAWGVNVADFSSAIRAHKDASLINLSIHSPGGSALDGLAMYNILKNHPATVNATVQGIAASAATTILMAADYIAMPEDTFLMIHNPWGGAMGEADEMREVADTLDKIKSSMANIYTKRSGLDEARVNEIMNAETWLTAAEAVELGFADEVTGAVKVAALSKDFAKHFAAMPAALAKHEIEFTTLKDAEAHLRDVARFSQAQAKSFVSQLKQILQRDVANDAEAQQEAEARISGALAAFSVPTSLFKD